MGATGSFLWGGGVGDVARHPRDISKTARICCDIMRATLFLGGGARGGGARKIAAATAENRAISVHSTFLCPIWGRSPKNLSVAGGHGVSQKGSRERCLPGFFFMKWKKTERKGRKRKKRKKSEPRKNSQKGKKWKWKNKEETGRKRKKLGSDTVPATPLNLQNPGNTRLFRTRGVPGIWRRMISLSGLRLR